MINVRLYTPDDYPQLLAIQRACFPPPFPEDLLWTRAQIESHCRVFPEGAIAAEIDGRLVGSSTAHIVRFNPGGHAHTWSGATADGFLTNHDPAGDTLYGADICVIPEARGRGVARAMYRTRYALVRRLGLKRFVAGSRLSGYRQHAHRLTPEQYASEVAKGRMIDPVITPQLKSGLTPYVVVNGYLPDHDSCDCALLMAWINPDFEHGP